MDVVITWVDGDDPRHIARRRAHLAPGAEATSGANPTRFASRDEIFFCLSSIFRFAPFVERIHIVTDDQIPPCLNSLSELFPDQIGKVRIVDHKEIFRGHEECLPTFNSISIAAMLHRIEGLAREYVYFNDDVVLLRPVAPTDFFLNGAPVIRAQRALLLPLGLDRLMGWLEFPRGRISFKGAQRRAARLSGARWRYLRHDHTPHPFRRSTLETFYAAHPDLLIQNACHKFRSAEQFGNAAIAYHLEYMSGNTEVAPTRLVYLRPVKDADHQAYLRRKLAECADPSRLFACFQSLDMLDQIALGIATNWLQRHLGVTRDAA